VSDGPTPQVLPDALHEDGVRKHLSTGWVAARLVCSAQTDSTNSDAAALGREGAAGGTVVIADAQRAGRGRLGRSWVSTPGVNLYASVLMRPQIAAAEAPQLSLVAGVAVAATLEREGLAPRIKWPNDVLLEGRKVCGILTEVEADADRVGFVVIGVGVNLNSTLEHFPAELHDKATSVLLASGRRVDRERFAAGLLGELERCYERFVAGGFAALAPEWNSRAALLGSQVNVSGAGEQVNGRCLGIDRDGALLVEERAGVEPRRVLAGDVTLIGGYER